MGNGMMASAVRFLIGSAEWVCDGGELPAILDAMMHGEIPYDRMMRDEEGKGHFRVFLGDVDRVRAVCADFSSLRIERSSGLPTILWRYRKRWGLAVGALLFTLILWWSTHVIWSMEVEGNSRVSDAEILSLLESVGCGVGSYIPSLDLWQVSNRCLLLHKELVFLSVNLEGTHAQVVVMEGHQKEMSDTPPWDDSHPSNLVAARDGQIVRWEVSSGQTVVEVYDVVRQGELLVSGVVNTKVRPDNSFRLERSIGKVFAQTRREINVEIPLVQTEQVETERMKVEKSLIFFSYPQKLFKKGGNIPPEYDIIKEKTRWVLFRSVPFLSPLPLPIFTETVWAVRTEETEVTLSEAEAAVRARAMLWEEYGRQMEGKEPLSYEITEGMKEDGGAYVISMWVECIENIAKEVPIELSDISGAK